MESYILREGVLNDDTLYLAGEKEPFKYGYIAIIKQYVYQNEWTNREIIIRFKSKKKLNDYLAKNYPEF